MQLNEGYCPECGAPARYLLERVLLDTVLTAPDENGSVDYDNEEEGEVDWETTEPVEENGRVSVCCQSRHWWHTQLASS